jgi:hypothetical protein
LNPDTSGTQCRDRIKHADEIGRHVGIPAVARAVLNLKPPGQFLALRLEIRAEDGRPRHSEVQDHSRKASAEICVRADYQSVNQYPDWVHKRADELARAGNEFLEELRGDLKLPAMVADAENQERAFAAT